MYGLYNFVAVSLEPHYVLGESHFAQRELRLRDGAIVRENSCHRREFEAYDVWGGRVEDMVGGVVRVWEGVRLLITIPTSQVINL